MRRVIVGIFIISAIIEIYRPFFQYIGYYLLLSTETGRISTFREDSTKMASLAPPAARLEEAFPPSSAKAVSGMRLALFPPAIPGVSIPFHPTQTQTKKGPPIQNGRILFTCTWQHP
ncbi:hypothetical protein ACQCVE_18570, partial [Metabacillus sp. 113a]|uniref:hypothetical protein n=1 Tax=Metabacillus sp. 113a TaxID=3404706 RepID=UPI003CF54312